MSIDYREGTVNGPGGSTAAPSAVLYGLVASLALLNGLLAAGALIDDRQNGLLRRLRTVRMPTGTYLLGTALFIVIVAAATLGATLPAAGLPWVALLAAYLVAVAGLGLLLGAVLQSRFQLQVVAPLLSLFTGLIGGGSSLLVGLSGRFAALALLTPQGWLLKGLQAAAVGSMAWPAAAVLMAMGAVGTGLALGAIHKGS